jgi:tetratricopeptide (TPR) repeat protein
MTAAHVLSWVTDEQSTASRCYTLLLTLITVQMTVPMLWIRQTSLRGFVTLVALAWPHSTLAQAAPVDAAPPDPQAQSRFEAGVSAYEAGRFREAVERFKEADGLAPSALLSFNIAKVYERMADSRNALAYYRDYLRRLSDAENRRGVSARIGELEKALQATGVQQLSVLSTPVGATVSIDNVSRGVTPWTGELIPGPHTLELRLAGHREVITEIELPADHAIDLDTPLVALEPEAAPVATPVSASDTPVPVPVMQELDGAPRWWTWALLGGSAAALTGAGAFELARSDLEDQARRSQVQVEHLEKFEAMEQRQTVARVFLGVGIVAALAGGASLYFDLQGTEPAPPPVAFGCLPTGCTLEAGGRF